LLGGCKEHAGDIIAIEKGDRLIGGRRGKTCACWKKKRPCGDGGLKGSGPVDEVSTDYFEL